MAQVTVTQALDELKLLDARIRRAISNATFVTKEVGTKRTVSPAFGTVENFEKLAQGSFDSITSLIERWNKIKSAIVLSNAGVPQDGSVQLVTIQVGSQTMTVAEALERKGNPQKGKVGSLEYYKLFLSKMNQNFNQVVSDIASDQVKLDRQVDAWVESSFNGEVTRKTATSEQQATIDGYIAQRQPKMLDPLGLKQKIDDMQTFVEDFESNIKTALQVANARMEITIED